MLTILQPDHVPPGGWAFRDPRTDFLIKHNNLENLFNLATRHRMANNLTISIEEFTQVVCASTQGGGCSEGTALPGLMVQAQNLVSDMVQWAKSGFAMAPDDLLAERVAVCETCEHWGGRRGDSLVKGRCRLCGCNGIKLALATSKCPASKWAR